MNKFEFKGFEFRVIVRDGDPWFVAKDVLDVLGLSRSSTALLDDDEKGVHSVDTPSGQQQMAVLNEPGLYSLILRSRKERAREFKRWITHEVLPAIRETETYVPPSSSLADALAAGDTSSVLQLLKASVVTIEELERKNAEQAPRALAAEAQERAKDGQTVWDLKYAVAEATGTEPQMVHKTLSMIGAYEVHDGTYFKIRPRWADLLFSTPSTVGDKEYASGAPRVRPGKQDEFLARVKQQFSFRFGNS